MNKKTEKRDLYYVAMKVFLRKTGKLLIIKDVYGEWDLPGGRIKRFEFNKPLKSVIKRKLNEELGPEVEYTIGDSVSFMRHEREEATQGNKKVRIFAVGYDTEYHNGKIRLGEHHEEMEWVEINTFKPESYFTGGWLDGVREYQSWHKERKNARTT